LIAADLGFVNRLVALSGIVFLVPFVAGATTLERTAVSGGAVAVADASFSLRGTVGEAGVVGLASGASLILQERFWAGHLRQIATVAPSSEGEAEVEFENHLRQNFPNPFRGTTSISFTVGQPSPVNLSVYDVAGRRVATLVNGVHEPGRNRVVWDGRDGSGHRVAAGIYFYRLEIGSWMRTKKLLRIH